MWPLQNICGFGGFGGGNYNASFALTPPKSSFLPFVSLCLYCFIFVCYSFHLGEDSAKYNDRRMAITSTGPFKPSTRKQTISTLEIMPSLDQMLGWCFEKSIKDKQQF